MLSGVNSGRDHTVRPTQTSGEGSHVVLHCHGEVLSAGCQGFS